MVTKEQYQDLLTRFQELQAILESKIQNPPPAPTPAPTPTPKPKPKAPKVTPPTAFAGASKECGIYFHVRTAEFPDTLSQILFVLSYMKGGAMGAWVTQHMIMLLMVGSPAITMDEFMAELNAMFQDPNREATTQHKLVTLQQGNDSMDRIIQEFEIHGPPSQLGDHLDHSTVSALLPLSFLSPSFRPDPDATPRSLLYVWAALVPGYTALPSLTAVTISALLDSGVTGNFISPDFIQKHRLETTPLPQPIPVCNVDGTPNKNGAITEELEALLTFGQHTEWARFAVRSTGHGRRSSCLVAPPPAGRCKQPPSRPLKWSLGMGSTCHNPATVGTRPEGDNHAIPTPSRGSPRHGGETADAGRAGA
ncbi:uncharacterized protein EI90DRAFT_3124688 [Cantharellus anzutake]|uniref:uncharacterized protein n=1 Tax=Cantharellus anzutake TaxID=1750568 RepID=UPI0019085986|nr:uncharacterized protein EI90DRAFT_3124688 [Cantharellus anzutake]KAF8330204.1 hypothetical protein EI90DRAFT_3124688 [Cantharellus anzutake]